MDIVDPFGLAERRTGCPAGLHCREVLNRGLGGPIRGVLLFPQTTRGEGEVKPGRDSFLSFPSMTHKLPRDTPRLFFLVESPTFQHLFFLCLVLLTYAYRGGCCLRSFSVSETSPFGLYFILFFYLCSFFFLTFSLLRVAWGGVDEEAAKENGVAGGEKG